MSQRKQKWKPSTTDRSIELTASQPVARKRETILAEPVGQSSDKGTSGDSNSVVSVIGHVFGDPERDRCRTFRSRFGDLPIASVDPLYVIPPELLTSLQAVLPRWLTPEEMRFEQELSRFCGSGRAGIAEDSRLMLGPLNPPAVDAQSIADAAAFADGSKNSNASAELNARAVVKIAMTAERRLAPLRDMRQAYLGWLLTNKEFLTERDRVRDRRARLGLRLSFQTVWDREHDTEFASFSAKWLISSFASWDLPVPQGSNMSGIALPAAAGDCSPAVTIQLPVTMGLPVRYPTLNIIREARLTQCPPHLRGWVTQLDSSRAGRFINVFRLHFYRDIVLKSRYAARFRGNVERLDRVMAEFLGLSEEAVRKLRRLIPRNAGS